MLNKSIRRDVLSYRYVDKKFRKHKQEDIGDIKSLKIKEVLNLSKTKKKRVATMFNLAILGGNQFFFKIGQVWGWFFSNERINFHENSSWVKTRQGKRSHKTPKIRKRHNTKLGDRSTIKLVIMYHIHFIYFLLSAFIVNAWCM